MKKIIFSLLVGGSMFAGCYYDKADVVNPNSILLGCDTANVSYAGSIASYISNTGCNTCHGSAVAKSSGGGIILDTYEGVKTEALNGELLPSVRQDATCSVCTTPNYEPMPKGGGHKPSSCTLNQIAAWINQGAKNN